MSLSHNEIPDGKDLTIGAAEGMMGGNHHGPGTPCHRRWLRIRRRSAPRSSLSGSDTSTGVGNTASAPGSDTSSNQSSDTLPNGDNLSGLDLGGRAATRRRART